MKSLLILPALLVAAPALAQQTDEQLWLAATATTGIGGGNKVTIESIGRFSDDAGGFFHDEFGAVLSFPVSKRIELMAGYRHVDDYDHGRAKPNEERLRQMIGFQLGGGFSARLRLEERFQSTSSAVAVRIRPLLRYTLPLGGKGVALVATQEHYLNFNTTRWGQRSGYERLRNSVAISLPLSKTLRGDLGYLNQYRFGRGGKRDTMDHALTFSLALTL